MQLVGRGFRAGSGYRYGFNGKENDDETSENSGAIDFGDRLYDGRICRFFRKDKMSALVSSESPYAFAGNSPISKIDVEGNFKFSAAMIRLLKEKYPTAYKYLIENVVKKKPGNISELANSPRIINAFIVNTYHHNLSKDHNRKTDGQGRLISLFYKQEKFRLTKDKIIDAFKNGNGPFIEITSMGEGFGGYNPENDGTDYSTPIYLNEELFRAIENASTEEELEYALINLSSTLLHEYLEDFSDDDVYCKDSNGNPDNYGIYKAQAEIYGSWIRPSVNNKNEPGDQINFGAKSALSIRGKDGTDPDPTVLPKSPGKVFIQKETSNDSNGKKQSKKKGTYSY